MQTDTEMFAREMFPAGDRVQPGLYKPVDSTRVVELEFEDFVPARLDGQIAYSVRDLRYSIGANAAVGPSPVCSVEPTLDGIFCEVIGCFEQACWILILPQGVSSEECLCNRHRDLLRVQDPDRASHYTQLSSLLREGSELMSLCQTHPTVARELK